jgi:hypothetical protein
VFDNLKNAGRQMNLPRIDTGVNGLEIRLWITSLGKQGKLIVLRKAGALITSQQFEFYFTQDSIADFKPISNQKNNSLGLLTDSLSQIDFAKMISQDEIENFRNDILDGVGYTMEISNSHYYKLLTYTSPAYFAKTEANNKKFLDIIQLLDRHLHFYPRL